ncbi:MAG: hypothetical protein IH856_04715 [Deltaproteobacteria bacterium]|nr:hypothetical protein [Deltaproteobacteria bacterium]
MKFELGPDATGTYVKVIQFTPSIGGDAHLVLYLLKSGLYLFIGHWRGYELTTPVGRWIEKGDRVHLSGVGATVSADILPNSSTTREYNREFVTRVDGYSPMLVAEAEYEGWSLLSWRGSLIYLGRSHYFDLEDERLPGSWQEIEPWVNEFLGSSGAKVE